MYAFEKKLQDLGLSLDDDILHPEFKEKINVFKSLEKANSPKEELQQIDSELCDLFDQLHEIEEADGEDDDEISRKQASEKAKAKLADVTRKMSSLEKKNKELEANKEKADQIRSEKAVKLGLPPDATDNQIAEKEAANTGQDEAEKKERTDLDERAEKVGLPKGSGKEDIEAKEKENESSEQHQQQTDVSAELKKKGRLTKSELKAMGIDTTGNPETIQHSGVKLKKRWLLLEWDVVA